LIRDLNSVIVTLTFEEVTPNREADDDVDAILIRDLDDVSVLALDPDPQSLLLVAVQEGGPPHRRQLAPNGRSLDRRVGRATHPQGEHDGDLEV